MGIDFSNCKVLKLYIYIVFFVDIKIYFVNVSICCISSLKLI